MQLSKANRGDTIVEVILALAVLSLIIVGGYSIATRSLAGVQIAKERSEALKVAEGQMENLKYRFSKATNFTDLLRQDGVDDPLGPPLYDPAFPMPIGIDGTGLPSNKLGFCFVNDGSGSVVRFLEPTGGLGDFANYPTGDPGNPVCNYGRYHVYITTLFDPSKIINPTDPVNQQLQFTYKVNVTWDKLGGGEVETLQLQDKITFKVN